MLTCAYRCGIVALVILSCTPSAHADFIVNGSFENPIASYGYLTYYGGSTEIPGWIVGGVSVDVVTTLSWPYPPRVAYDGTQWLDLDGTGAGQITQSFLTTAGAKYTLRFAYANNPYGTLPAAATVNLFDSTGVFLSSLLVHSTTTDANPDWTIFQTSFVARELTTSLQFTSNDPTGSVGGIALDAVSVEAVVVPEPSSILLAAISALMLLCKARHFRTRQLRNTD